MKKYYFYFDEGGMIGKTIVAITEQELKVKNKNDHENIANYLFGYLPAKSISRHIQLFKHAFPKATICVDERSIIGITEKIQFEPFTLKILKYDKS